MVTASGGQGTQFSWFQGGFVRPLFITACGEISFIKMVRLGGATLLTTCWKNIIHPPFGGSACDCFFSPSCSVLLSFPPHLPPFLSAPSLARRIWELGLGAAAAAASLCLGGWAQHLNTLWEGRHACVLQVWTPKGQGAVDRMLTSPGSAAVLLVFAARTAPRIRAGAQ